VSAVELLPGKIRARLAQDLIGLAKLPVLPLEGLEPGCHIARQARFVPAVALGLLHPLIKRLRRAPNLVCYRDDIPGATAASVLYAVDQGWIELEGVHSVCLTEEGRPT
jgi:hypothetical protein